VSSQNLPVYGPTDPFGDEEHEPEVIVRVDFLMSREQLVTALGIAWAEIAGDGRDPESLTIAETRHEVEAYLSVQAFHALGVQLERDRQRVFPPEQQRVMDVLAAAVDRAYPTASASGMPDTQARRGFAEEFPLVAAHLARERGENVVAVDTIDAGRVEGVEPAWCRGEHADGEYRADFNHQGEEYPLVVDTPGGQVQVATAFLYQRPFAEGSTRAVVVPVEFDSEAKEYDSTSLAGLADALVAYAVGPLHQLIERLQLLGGEPR
jgi:hypothetical protein